MSKVAGSVLITGGAGFVGQNLVSLLAKQKLTPRIVVLDALTYASNPTELEPLISSGKINFVHGDISDLELVRELFGSHNFDAVMHLAAESHVDRSIADPDAFVRTNIFGTYVLLKCALEKWRNSNILSTARFLQVSTDEVFGDLKEDDRPFTESSSYRPNSPYSATKAGGDHLARAYSKTYRLPVIITNCSNNYGPRQHPEKLIPLAIVHALLGETLPIYGDGLNRRDWLFVDDHCRALILALEHGIPGRSYNVGGGSEQTNIAVVEAICDLINAMFVKDRALAKKYPSCPAARGGSCRKLISFVRDRPGHDRRYAIDSTYSKNSLGYIPRESFSSGLANTVRWYLDNDVWWRRALDVGFHEWVAKNYGSHTR